MKNIMQEIDREQVDKLIAERSVPEFQPGDTLRVMVKVIEGARERVQAFEGVCIGRKNAGTNSAFTVRKISYGEGVERVFPLHSPRIESIEIIRRGDVRRAKLYYLRGRTGKRARIAERVGRRKIVNDETVQSAVEDVVKKASKKAPEKKEAAKKKAPEKKEAAKKKAPEKKEAVKRKVPEKKETTKEEK